MKIAVYPGNFNPFHKGHADVLMKSSRIFEKIIIATTNGNNINEISQSIEKIKKSIPCETEISSFTGLFSDYIDGLFKKHLEIVSIIRGIKNSCDFQNEMSWQYWNEDLGITIPTVYFIPDRTLSHLTSSSIREVKQIKGIK